MRAHLRPSSNAACCSLSKLCSLGLFTLARYTACLESSGKLNRMFGNFSFEWAVWGYGRITVSQQLHPTLGYVFPVDV